MWINSLYLWPVICSKNPCSRYLLFRWGSCRWLAPGHTACGWQGQDKIWSGHNPFGILSYSVRNSENTDNCWQFLGSLSHFHYSPVPRPNQSSQSTGRVTVGFQDTKYMVSTATTSNSPNTHWVSASQFYSDTKSRELVQILHVEGSKLSSILMTVNGCDLIKPRKHENSITLLHVQ